VGRNCLPGGPGRRISSVFLRHAAWHPLCDWHGVASPSTVYEPRTPSQGVLYQVVRDHFETFRAQAAGLRDGEGLPRFVEQEFRDFLRCGCLAGGFARFRCDDCSLDRLVPFSCKARACCPSCGPSTMLRAVPSKVEGRRTANGGTRRASGGSRVPAGAGTAVGLDAAASAALPAGVGPRPVLRGGPSTMLRAIPSRVEGWSGSACGRSSASSGTWPARAG